MSHTIRRNTRARIACCVLLLATAGLLNGLVGCTRGSTPAADAKAPLGNASFRMKWVTYGNYAGDVAGEKWGIWKKRGLDVKVQQGGPGIHVPQLVAAGTDQFGSTGPDELAIAINQGLPLVAIAAEMQITPVSYLVHPDSNIRTPEDFVGKRYQVIPSHNSYYEYLILCKKRHLDRSRITEVTSKSLFQLWRARQVDVAVAYNNLAVAYCKRHNVPLRLLRSMDFGIRNYGNVLFTTRKYAQEHPEAVKAFIQGFFEAWAAAWADPARAIEVVKEYDPATVVSQEIDIANMLRPYVERRDGRHGWMETARWKEQLDTFFEAGIIDKRLEPEDVFTNRFCEEIYGKPSVEKPLSPLELPPHEQTGKT